MKTTLLIMAAGIGSRFGTGIKQLEPVDDAGHIIMDYSIHDAIEAGFNHVVFIIRKDIEKEFKEVIGDRIASICKSHNVTVDYAFQDINDIPGELPAGRTKPWGTGQAVLAAKKVIETPFIVINADDYYGKEGFKAVHEYLVNGGKSCILTIGLKNALLLSTRVISSSVFLANSIVRFVPIKPAAPKSKIFMCLLPLTVLCPSVSKKHTLFVVN